MKSTQKRLPYFSFRFPTGWLQTFVKKKRFWPSRQTYKNGCQYDNCKTQTFLCVTFVMSSQYKYTSQCALMYAWTSVKGTTDNFAFQTCLVSCHIMYGLSKQNSHRSDCLRQEYIWLWKHVDDDIYGFSFYFYHHLTSVMLFRRLIGSTMT